MVLLVHINFIIEEMACPVGACQTDDTCWSDRDCPDGYLCCGGYRNEGCGGKSCQSKTVCVSVNSVVIYCGRGGGCWYLAKRGGVQGDCVNVCLLFNLFMKINL